MRLGRKIRNIKSKILLLLRKYIPRTIYDLIVYQLAKNKFLICINSLKKNFTNQIILMLLVNMNLKLHLKIMKMVL